MEEQAKQAIDNSFYTVVAMIDEMPVGMACVIGDELYYLLADVVVNPQYQGKGYSKEDFYKKLGFRELPNKFCGLGMRKAIKKR